MPPKQQAYVFGSLEGMEVGTRTVSLFELRQTGIHACASNKHVTKNGVVSVIVGEKDSDDGELIVMVSDIKTKCKAKATSLKAAVFQNFTKRIPIRVVRCYKIGGQFSPLYGYRYDGLYVVDFLGEETISVNKKRLYIHLYRLPNQPVLWEMAPMLLQILPFPRSGRRGERG